MIPTLQEAVDFLRSQKCKEINVSYTTFNKTEHLEISGENNNKKFIIYTKTKNNGKITLPSQN